MSFINHEDTKIDLKLKSKGGGEVNLNLNYYSSVFEDLEKILCKVIAIVTVGVNVTN